MDGFNRVHPDGGYGLGRHAPMPAPPQQSAQQLAQGAPAATTATPAAAAPTPPPGVAQRAQHLLAQRRPQPAAPAPAPSLAAPPPAAPAPAPLAAPPPTPASSPLAAPAPPTANPALGGQIAGGWLYGADGTPLVNYAPNPRGAGGFGDARDLGPNAAAMGVFYDPSKKAGDVTGYYNDYLRPELRANPGGTQVSLQQAGITPGGAGDPTWDPSGVIAAAAKARQ